nr:hypothetical protein [Tanacetum cinerariifolium]
MGEMDINTLTLEQYMALTRRNHGPRVMRPEITNNVNFEIKSQFMKILGITHLLETMRMILMSTCKRAAKRWKNRLPTGSIDTWALLEKAFIQKYCPPSRTAKRLFKATSFDHSSSPEFELFSDHESLFEEGITKTITEPTMEKYIMKTQKDYGSGVARPKFDEDAKFELKGQFLKELCDHTFSRSENKDANEHIEEEKTLKEAYYTQFGVPFPQAGRYRATAPGFYQRN